MLDKIIKFFEESNNSMTLKSFSKKLGIETSALKGMLDFLVKKGKLKLEYQNEGSNSNACNKGKAACISCSLNKAKSNKGKIKYYTLAD